MDLITSFTLYIQTNMAPVIVSITLQTVDATLAGFTPYVVMVTASGLSALATATCCAKVHLCKKAGSRVALHILCVATGFSIFGEERDCHIWKAHL